MMKRVFTIFLSLILLTSFFTLLGSYKAGATEEAEHLATSVDGIATADPGQILAASGNNRFVVWIDNSPGNWDILFRRSTDSGATWMPTANLSLNPGRSGSPQMLVSGSNIHIIWLQTNAAETSSDVFYRRSIDNGATWGARINLSTSGSLDPFNYIGAPSIKVSGTNIYVVWLDEGQSSRGDVFFRRSIDNGGTWKSIVNLSTNAIDSYNPTIAVLGSHVYVAWKDGYGTFDEPSDISFRRSADNGATWKAKLKLSNSGDIDRFHQPVIGAASSNVYVAWVSSNAESAILKRSTNNGATFGSTKPLSGFVGESHALEMDVAGSNVYVTVTSFDTLSSCGFDQSIALNRSTDSGATFSSKTLAEGYISIPSVAASGSNLFVLYSEGEALDCGESGPREVYVLRSTNSGGTFSPRKNLSNNDGNSWANNIALFGTSVYAVWSDSTPGNSEIFFKRSTDNGVTWKATKNLSSNSGASSAAGIGT